MKKNYEAPELEILAFATGDVIETSGESTALYSAETPEDWFSTSV